MSGNGIKKLGWHWTRKGWKRIPRHLLQVKSVPLPTKRKTRKLRRMVPVKPRPDKQEAGIAIEAQKLTVEQGRAESAPTLAAKLEILTQRKPRQAWGGKYDAISPSEPKEPKP